MDNNIQLKQQLTPDQLQMLHGELEMRKKSKVVMYLLWIFMSTFGAHRFYLGDTGYAVAMLFFGWLTLFLWPLIDVFFIGKRIDEKNTQLELEIISQIRANQQPQSA
ncbi:TM2 domain-containing protein [Marininema halotolerans]|uniref:TM2 domain-containing protein n=1 Tax=Marininema halotolerans TaxID=1155944 RepID=A0A1I6QKI7_9BACL|nr:TM2 domain-containing protein [Marininema halotolerans]SFS53007.1 TM2 domain-containing protein [Marininema halotolerans]